VQYGPTEEDRRRAAAKRLKERETRSSVQAVEKDLDMLASLLDEGAHQEGPRESRTRRQQQEEDDYFRQSELSQLETRQSDARQQPRQSEQQQRYSEAPRVSEVRKPSRNSGRTVAAPQRHAQDEDEEDGAYERRRRGRKTHGQDDVLVQGSAKEKVNKKQGFFTR
jgi:hypothetical protein